MLKKKKGNFEEFLWILQEFMEKYVKCPHDVPSALHLGSHGSSFIVLNCDSPWKPRHNASWHGCQNVIEATWWLPLENPAGGQFQQNQGDEKWSSLERRFQGRDASLFAMKSSTFSDILGLGHTSGRWSTFILQCYFQTSEQENLVILDIHWRYIQNILCNLQMK